MNDPHRTDEDDPSRSMGMPEGDEGSLEPELAAAKAAEAGKDPRSPDLISTAPRRGARKKRLEPPVLVIEPDRKPSAARQGPGHKEKVRENLEGQVQGLLAKVHDAEDDLRRKGESLDRLRRDTEAVVRQISRQGKAAGEVPSSTEDAPTDTDLKSLDLYARPGAAAGAPRAGGKASPEAPAGKPSSKTGPCPVCGRKLRKARCMEVNIIACLSCRAVFLDNLAVRQLSVVLPWMHHVERFLRSASRTVETSRKPA